MKKIIILIFVFLVQSQTIFGQITANKTSGCAPLTGVQFSSPTTGDWDFGNGASATAQLGGTNISTIYADHGVYTVTFDDGSGPITETITVYGNPTPDFLIDGPESGCIPFSTSFGDSSEAQGSSSIVGWQWAFGDGAASTFKNPNHTYTILGTYTVSLIVTDNNGCDSTAVKTDYVSVQNAPTASFTASPTSSCTAPLNVTLNNNSVNSSSTTSDLTYEWDFGDTQTSNDENPAPHNYSSPGVFALKLTVTEDGGCSRSQTKIVSIGNPIAAINVADTVCLSSNVNYFNGSTGGSSFSWVFDDGGTSNLENPLHIFNTPGNHDVTLTISDGSCADTVTKSVFVQEVIPTLLSTPTYLCEKPYCIDFTANGTDIVNWSYDFGDGNGSNTQNPEHCYNIGGDEYTVYYYGGYHYEARVTATNSYGCSGSATVIDTIFPLSANFAPNITQGCAPLTINFEDSSASGSSIVSYEYDFGDGNSASTENATHTFNTAGEYEVLLTLENANGCRDTSFPIQIQVGDTIDVDLNISPSTVCIGDTVTITDASSDSRIDYYHFSTDENRGSESCPDSPTQQWSYFHEAGQHDVTFYANYNGCISEKVFTGAVTVNGPSSYFKWSGLCASPTEINLTATVDQVDSLYWYFGDGDTLKSNDLADTAITHVYDTSGNYTVYLVSTNSTTGCQNDTDSMVVTVRMLEAVIDQDSLICSGGFTPSGELSIDVNGNCDNSYRWDYGDGSNMYLSDDPNWPTAITDTGTYTIRLMVYDVNGCRDTTEKTITITDIYAGFMSDTTTGCLPLTINLTDTSKSVSPIASWSWNYDDGNTGTGETSSHTFTEVTSFFDIELTVTDTLGCVDTEKLRINAIIPDSNFTVNDRTICVGDEVTFNLNNENSMSSAVWSFGNQGTANDLNPTFQFDTSGDYTINVQLTDTNGCIAERTITNYVFVDDYPIVGFTSVITDNGDTINNESVICYPEQVTFTDTSISTFGVTSFGSRTWDLGVSSPIVPSESVSWNYNKPGDYYITLIEETSNGCRDTVLDTISVVGPVANFSLSETLICVGDEITFDIIDSTDVFAYQWDFGNGAGTDTILTNDVLSSEVSNQYFEVPLGGNTVATLIIWSKDFVCDYPVKNNISVHNVEAKFEFEDSTVCLNDEVVFNDSSLTTGSTNYFWDIGDGNTSTSTEPFSQSYENSGTGTYSVVLTLNDPITGCKDTMIKTLEILPRPVVSATDGEMCFGDSALITASGALSYSWNDPIEILYPDSSASYALADQTITYTVTGTDTNGCVETAQSTVTVVEEQDLIEERECIIIGENATIGFDYGPGFTYDWTTGPTDFLVCKDCAVQTITITEEVDSIEYEVTYSDRLGCFPKVDKYTVCVEDKYTFDVPSAFTPNGTGENNVVYIKGHGVQELIYFRIYNRWGEMVFETNDINQGWDGTYKGNAQDMETFVYQAKVQFYNDKFGEKGGEITLIR